MGVLCLMKYFELLIQAHLICFWLEGKFEPERNLRLNNLQTFDTKLISPDFHFIISKTIKYFHFIRIENDICLENLYAL